MRVLIFLLLLLITPALAQDEHAQGHDLYHDNYRGWASQKTGNCCNNQDCHPLTDDEWRETSDGNVEILVPRERNHWNGRNWEMVTEGPTWCKIMQEHYVLPPSKSPNWETPHACIRSFQNGSDPCARILCFMGVPKS